MADFTRIISITSLSILSFFCFQTGIFLCSGHSFKKNGRRTLILAEEVVTMLNKMFSLFDERAQRV
jgi:hypothetical protein